MEKKELLSCAKGLRKNMTAEERKLWYDFLRRYPVRFYRQKVLGKYIVDFYCAKANLVIELDGAQHYEEEQEKYDQIRTEYLSERYHATVIRFLNSEINKNFKGVCEYIDITVKTAIGIDDD